MRAFHLLTIRIDGPTLHADVSNSQLLGEDLQKLEDDFERLPELSASVVRLDLRSVQFMDGRVPGALIKLSLSLTKVAARLSVVASPGVEDVLRVTKLDQLFEVIGRDGKARSTDSA